MGLMKVATDESDNWWKWLLVKWQLVKVATGEMTIGESGSWWNWWKRHLVKVATGESDYYDELRLYKRASEVQKKRWKYKAREKVVAKEIAIAEEGTTYVPEFWT